jgi:hypothetical protein
MPSYVSQGRNENTGSVTAGGTVRQGNFYAGAATNVKQEGGSYYAHVKTDKGNVNQGNFCGSTDAASSW